MELHDTGYDSLFDTFSYDYLHDFRTFPWEKHELLDVPRWKYQINFGTYRFGINNLSDRHKKVFEAMRDEFYEMFPKCPHFEWDELPEKFTAIGMDGSKKYL